MDPIIIIIKEMKNDKIVLTEEELKRIVQQAYNNGYWEGRKNYWNGYFGNSSTTITNQPYYTTNHTNTTGNPPLTNPNIVITCDSNNEYQGETANAIGD